MNLELGISTIDDDLLDRYALAIIKAPMDREQTAFNLCLGDFVKARELIKMSTSNAFTKRLIELRNNMPAASRLVGKEDFMVECRGMMTGASGALQLEWAKFYAKMAGFVDDSTVINNTMHVISVPSAPHPHDIKTVDAWEQSTMQHQNKLQSDARELNRGDDE